MSVRPAWLAAALILSVTQYFSLIPLSSSTNPPMYMYLCTVMMDDMSDMSDMILHLTVYNVHGPFTVSPLEFSLVSFIHVPVVHIK